MEASEFVSNLISSCISRNLEVNFISVRFMYFTLHDIR